MYVLIGVVLVIVGFALKINPLLVVTAVGIITALIGGIEPVDILNAFGAGFAGSRSVTTFAVLLPIIGLVERYGLQAQAGHLISKFRRLTTGRILALYMLVRQITAAVGLNTIGGPAQTVRPLVYPMAAAAEERRRGGDLNEDSAETIKGYSASADTIGVFFGEDAFVAIGSILLITSFVDTSYGLSLEPIELAIWAIPLGVAAFFVHGTRLILLDRRLERMFRPESVTTEEGRA